MKVKKMEPLNLDAQSNKELEKLLHLIGQDEVGERIPAITDREIETEYEVK